MTQTIDIISGKALPLKKLHGYIAEAESAHEHWRKESWIDSRFRDGQQWTQEEYQSMVEKGINPLTINRIFPVINMICGTYITNRHDIVAKGRTQQDAEISQTMSEALKFVMDQNGGFDLLYRAFENQVITGFGAMGVETNPDPRFEITKLRLYPWYSLWWDMYSSPWMNPDECRYVFYQDWKDLDAVMAMYPDKASELYEHYGELTSDSQAARAWEGEVDIGTLIEEQIQYLSNGSRWADKQRKRIRPCEMWYTVPKQAMFAVMPNGYAYEVSNDISPQEQYQLIQQADRIVQTIIKKIRVAHIVGQLVLNDIPSPLPHDQYPFIPFIGYTDSYNMPFGVPRQIREQDMEVNKRRSMALSLISNRRVIMERNTAEDHNQVYEEVNAQDGLIILNDGKSNTFQIQELGQMAPQQMDVMIQTEREIQEISGANNESLGYQTSGSQSNMALETKQKQSNVMTASMQLNLKRSQRMLGERVIAHIQRDWTAPKVLRVTDRVTGAETFTQINTPIRDPQSGQITIHNNLSQGRYDVIVTDAPLTDTIREKNLELIFSAIQKSPPEAIAPLLNLAFQLTDLPNKDQLLHQLRMALGVEPIDPLLTKAEAEQKAKERQQQLEQQQAAVAEQEQQTQALENQKIQAEIQKIMADIQAQAAEVNTEQAKVNLDRQKESREAYAAGHKIAQDIAKQRGTTKTADQMK